MTLDELIAALSMARELSSGKTEVDVHTDAIVLAIAGVYVHNGVAYVRTMGAEG